MISLSCSMCSSIFEKDEDIKGRICMPCENARQRLYRIRTGGISNRSYEKTIPGFIMRLYHNMKSRIDGTQSKKWHLYKGKEILPKREFYRWAVGNPVFMSLYRSYRANGYNRKLAPSVNRVDSNLGYSIKNMEFITNSENSRLGGISRWQKARAR